MKHKYFTAILIITNILFCLFHSGFATTTRMINDNNTCSPVVIITFTPLETMETFTINETLPFAITPTNINENAIWNFNARTIKWGSFFENRPYTLTYQLHGISEISTTMPIDGFISIDGVSEEISGDNEVSIDCITKQVEKPTFQPESGEEVPVNLVINCSTPDVEIHYTTDGSMPDINAPLYSNPLTLTSTTSLKAIAFKTGMLESKMSSASYREPYVPQVDFTRTVSNNATCFPSVSLRITPLETVESYSVEEILPFGISPSNINAQGIWNEDTHTIKWGAFLDNLPRHFTYELSGIDNTYDIIGSFASIDGRTELISKDLSLVFSCEKLANPVFEPSPCTNAPVNVKITCETSDATIYYTTDGSMPYSNALIYDSPVNVSSTTTIKAIAMKSGFISSEVVSASYTYNNQVASPVFEPSSGSMVPVNVNIYCLTPDAVIRYTTDGSTPDINSPVYEGPLNFETTTILKAMVFRSGMVDSELMSATYLTPGKQINTIINDQTCAPNIQLDITPVDLTESYTVENILPFGLKPHHINENGKWFPETHTIKWGAYLDGNARIFSYELSGPDGDYEIETMISYDGQYEDDTETLQLSIDQSNCIIDPFLDQAMMAGKTITVDFTLNNFSPGQQVVITGKSSHPEMIPDSNIIVTGDDENRTLSIASTETACGPVQVTLTIDDGNATTTDIFNMRIYCPGYMLDEEFKFYRMWPTLQQPWYFNNPSGMAIDSNDFIYVVEQGNHRIQKFSKDGILVSNWGTFGTDAGEFYTPVCITVDHDDFVYVGDQGNHRIQKFTQNGLFQLQWGNSDTQSDLFNTISGIASDNQGFIYVTDSENHAVQKFKDTGEFVEKWDNYGPGDGQFNCPIDIVSDKNGFLYIADFENSRIQKLKTDGTFVSEISHVELNKPTSISISENDIYVTDSQKHAIFIFNRVGEFIMKTGSYGINPGQFNTPKGMCVDSKNYLYVSDMRNQRIQIFSPENQVIRSWENEIHGDGYFYQPNDIQVDTEGYIYVSSSASPTATTNNHRVQRFSLYGEFEKSWREQLKEQVVFDSPEGIAVDKRAFVYIVDSGTHQVHKFNGSENENVSHILSWGSEGSDINQFRSPLNIAIDSLSNVYVVDSGNYRIQKFTSTGTFINQWGSFGNTNGQFEAPKGIAIDSNDFIYVTDSGNNHRVQKFNSDGDFIYQWGGFGQGDGQFNSPYGIAVDRNNFLYVADMLNHRIQKFTNDGQYLSKFGEFGSGPGFFNMPKNVFMTASDILYITDYKNNRIQAFKQMGFQQGLSKAIIVAGGGPYKGNNLWNDTQMCANLAYRSLTYQGFTKDTICLLSPVSDLDIDHNGEADDVDKLATKENLCTVITDWAKDADSLFIYLVDHGGVGKFRLNMTTYLYASEINSWLDEYQTNRSGTIFIVYDACNSGSFISELSSQQSEDRIIITSASSNESAHFLSQGVISFSGFFWTQIFNGYNLKNAFDYARDVIEYKVKFQHPNLDDNNNGVGNDENDGLKARETYIGNGMNINSSGPEIIEVSPNTTYDNGPLSIYAVFSTDYRLIDRVWAVVRPPNYNTDSHDNAVMDLPYMELKYAGNNRYEVFYNDFQFEGKYFITIYARDKNGRISNSESIEITVNPDQKRKALIVVGEYNSKYMSIAAKNLGYMAYNVLLYQQYSSEDIIFLAPDNYVDGVDNDPTLANIDNAFVELDSNATRDVVIYMVGTGDSNAYLLNKNSEKLLAHVLNQNLNILQNNIAGPITVIYDAKNAKNYLTELIPTEEMDRILISSTGSDQDAYFLFEGYLSFSQFFWRQLFYGSTLRNARLYSKYALRYLYRKSSFSQIPDIVYGSVQEKKYRIGIGIMLAGDEPLVGSIDTELLFNNDDISLSIKTGEVSSCNPITQVWAVIVPQDITPTADEPVSITELPYIDLTYNEEKKQYEGNYDNIEKKIGYNVSVYAKDTSNNVSFPATKEVFAESPSDIYENDDTYQQANSIFISNPDPQRHNFVDEGDQDWVMFYAIKDVSYTIEISNFEEQYCNPVIEIFDSDGTYSLITIEDEVIDGIVSIDWEHDEEDRILYVKISNYFSDIYGDDTGYDLRVHYTEANIIGYIFGIVKDAISGAQLSHVTIQTDLRTAISRSNGQYYLGIDGGNYNITASKEGYELYDESIQFSEFQDGRLEHNININPISQELTLSGHIKNSDNIAISNVTINLTNDGGTTTTDASGIYNFTVNSGWGGSIIPSHSCYVFVPENVSYNDVQSNQTQNFIGTKISYSISGFIKEPDGIPISNSTLTFTNNGGSTTTNASGYYTKAFDCAWSGSLSISHNCFSFDPSNYEFHNIQANSENNYTGTHKTHIISGNINDQSGGPISNVFLRFSDNESVTTNSQGSYSKTITCGWSGDVVISHDCYTFSPSTFEFNNIQENTDKPFEGNLKTHTISGTVKDSSDAPISNVVLRFSDNESVTTNSQGLYSKAVTCGWSGSVSISHNCFTFDPSYFEFSNIQENTDKPFEGTLNTNIISGTINDSKGNPISNAVLRFNDNESVTTNSQGSYSKAVTCGWSGSDSL